MIDNRWAYCNPYLQTDLEQLRYMLAKAYVPYQMYYHKYPLDKALMIGTLFPELVKPWPPYYYEEVVKD
ncbi:spore coat associated protein CotJA [Clostridiaceae bacterium 35-E11]